MSDHTTYDGRGEAAGRGVCHRCGDPLVQVWPNGVKRLPKNLTVDDEVGEIRGNCCTCNAFIRVLAGTAEVYHMLVPLTGQAGTAILTA